jgi:hypothetical protein
MFGRKHQEIFFLPERFGQMAHSSIFNPKNLLDRFVAPTSGNIGQTWGTLSCGNKKKGRPPANERGTTLSGVQLPRSSQKAA